MSIGEKIKQYASLKKISLRRLASEAEINYNTLYALISRKSNSISIDNINKIAKVLGIPAEALLGTDNSVIESDITDADIKLATTINAIIGVSKGEERENKLYLINSFLEADADLIENIYEAITKNKGV